MIDFILIDFILVFYIVFILVFNLAFILAVIFLFVTAAYFCSLNIPTSSPTTLSTSCPPFLFFFPYILNYFCSHHLLDFCTIPNVFGHPNVALHIARSCAQLPRSGQANNIAITTQIKQIKYINQKYL